MNTNWRVAACAALSYTGGVLIVCTHANCLGLRFVRGRQSDVCYQAASRYVFIVHRASNASAFRQSTLAGHLVYIGGPQER